MGSRGSVTGLGPMGINVSPMGGAVGGGTSVASGPRNGSGVGEVGSIGRYPTPPIGPNLPLTHGGPPVPGPTLHTMGQIGILAWIVPP